MADYSCWVGAEPDGSWDCGAQILCACGGFTFVCAPPRDGDFCFVADESCFIEGTGTCDIPPAGGGCSCGGGHWSCFSGCPYECPAVEPTPGAACSVPAGAICRYSGSSNECDCISGQFRCCDVAPCP